MLAYQQADTFSVDVSKDDYRRTDVWLSGFKGGESTYSSGSPSNSSMLPEERKHSRRQR